MFTLLLYHFYAIESDIKTMDDIQIKGKDHMHRLIPGVLDGFKDISFTYNALDRHILADVERLYKITVDENIYNRIILQNGNSVIDTSYGTTIRKRIVNNDSYSSFSIELIKKQL